MTRSLRPILQVMAHGKHRSMIRFALAAACAAFAAWSCGGGAEGTAAPVTSPPVTPPVPAPVPASVLVVSGNGQAATVGATLASPLVVRVADRNAAAVAGVIITWAVSAGSGVLSPTTSVTDAG